MKQYKELVNHVLEYGEQRGDRTGTGTISVFGYQSRFDLQKGFPLLTTKKMAVRGIFAELIWFLLGSTDERDLCFLTHGTRDSSKTTIWTANANAFTDSCYYGDCGEIYGEQWRRFGFGIDGNEGFDQIGYVLNEIRTNPNSRRIIVTAYNPNSLDFQCLPACHTMFQFYVRKGEFLDCQLYQRSADIGLGVSFNVASYALLTEIIAKLTGLKAGHFVHTIGDAHIYLDHIEPLKEQMARECFELPKLILPDYIKSGMSVDDFLSVIKVQDLVDSVKGYECHPSIKMEMSV